MAGGLIALTGLIILSPLFELFSRIEIFLRRKSKKKACHSKENRLPKPLTRPITSRYADNPDVTIDPDKIPEPIRSILPFAKDWAIGDDKERTEYEASLSVEDLKLFVDAVWPKMDAIEDYCSKHRGDVPVPDEVVLLDMMMEAVTEVYYEVYPGDQ